MQKEKLNDNQSRAQQGESGWEQQNIAMRRKWEKYTLGCKAEVNWNEECKEINLYFGQKNTLSTAWGRETDPYPTHKPLKRASVAGAANRFSSACAAFWWLSMPAQEEGWEMKLLLLCSLGDEGRNCGKFLRSQEWQLSKSELGLLPTWPSPFSSVSFFVVPHSHRFTKSIQSLLPQE